MRPKDVPLRRNREFALLQAGRLLSNAGTESTTIAVFVAWSIALLVWGTLSRAIRNELEGAETAV